MTAEAIAGLCLTVMLAMWADLKGDIREIRAALGIGRGRVKS